jgi:hypothetical protein
MHDSLMLAFLHFSNSVGVLACSQPADSLALAAEKAVCCAAGVALVAAAGRKGRKGAGAGMACSCCRCSAVLQFVDRVLQEVVSVVVVHLGKLV